MIKGCKWNPLLSFCSLINKYLFVAPNSPTWQFIAIKKSLCQTDSFGYQKHNCNSIKHQHINRAVKETKMTKENRFIKLTSNGACQWEQSYDQCRDYRNSTPLFLPLPLPLHLVSTTLPHPRLSPQPHLLAPLSVVPMTRVYPQILHINQSINSSVYPFLLKNKTRNQNNKYINS